MEQPRPRRTAELPSEVMMEIFVRLPVRTLIRLKSVSRSWRSLIEDPYFIADHLNRSSSNRFHIARYYSDTDMRYIVSLLSWETIDVLRRIEIPSSVSSGYPNIVDSCNGILCLWSGGRISLLNPATREFRLLPDSSSFTGPTYYPCYAPAYHGFGFNQRIHDHKLIRIEAASCSDRNRNRYRAHVFAIKEGLWRELEVPPPNCDIIYKFEGTALNGVVHWIARGGGSHRSELILSFDLGDDKFDQQPIPDLAINNGDYKRLTVFKQSLRLIVYSESKRYSGCGAIEVWERSSRASQHTWARLLRIEEPRFGAHRPVGWGAFGEILIENDYGKLVAYETTTGVVRHVHIDLRKRPVYFNFHPFTESLYMLTR